MLENEGKRRAIAEIETYLVEQRTIRPSAALAAGRSPKAIITIGQILAAGHRVFVRDGHAGLSLRKVADEAGVAVGNVNYYFETKRALIEAVLCEALADYIEEHIQQFEAGRDSPRGFTTGLNDWRSPAAFTKLPEVSVNGVTGSSTSA